MLNFLILYECLALVVAFVPSKENTVGRERDYSHESITELGMYQAASYYITHYLYPEKYNGSNYDYVSVLKQFYSTDPDSFRSYGTMIEEVVKYNNLAQRQNSQLAMRTMNGEMIEAGNLFLKSLRKMIISNAKSPSPNWDFIREKIGEYLFTMQMFYSNTNWVELFGNLSCKELGIEGKQLIPTAPAGMATCRSCNYTLMKSESDSCLGNILLDIDYLTSGYTSYQDVNKPLESQWGNDNGKCSHGGPADQSKDVIALGGINKETSDLTLSPHYYLHQAAGQAAVQATVDFFIGNDTGLLSLIGPDAFSKLFRLKYINPCYQCFSPDKSVAFVIDNTGSMGDDIFAVRKEAVRIVNSAILRGANGPHNYVLATFNDPNTTVTTSKNGSEMIALLQALRANGGGDCPEMAMAGLLKGIQHANPGSCVFFFTDADAKDDHLASDVASLINTKHIKLTLFLRGACSQQSPDKVKNTTDQVKNDGCLIKNTQAGTLSRRKRSGLSGLDFFESLAASSGSTVAHVDKSTLTSTLDSIVKHNMGISTISIDKFAINSGPKSVPVDNDLNLISIKLVGISSASEASLVSPDGMRNQGTVNDVGHQTVIISVTNPVSGNWSLTKTGSGTWNVDVTGSGSISFTFKFMEKVAGYFYPYSGSSPIAGIKLSLSVKVSGLQERAIVHRLLLKKESGQTIWQSNVSDTNKNPSRSFVKVIEIPKESFFVSIEGDNNGTLFRRCSPDITTPVTGRLEIVSTIDQLSNGRTTTVIVNVTNEGSVAQSFVVDARDSLSYIQSGQSTAMALNPQQSRVVPITLLAGNPKDVTTLTVELKSGGIVLQTERKSFVVAEINIPDVTIESETPACEPHSLNYYNCSNQRWNITCQVVFSTDMSDLSTPSHDVKVTVDTTDNRTYTVTLSGSCCHAKTSLFVSDKAHNIVTRVFDFTDGVTFSNDVDVRELFKTEAVDGTHRQGPLTTVAIVAVVIGSVVGLVILTNVAALVFKRIYHRPNNVQVDEIHRELNNTRRHEKNGKKKYTINY